MKADWRYGSAIYDRDGDVLADAGGDRRRTVLVAAVEPGDPTPYAAIGDAVGWASLALALAVWIGARAAGVATRKRRIPAWDSAA